MVVSRGYGALLKKFGIPALEFRCESTHQAFKKSRGSNGAGKEARTPDLNLGKVALYQLSYSRPKQTRNCRVLVPRVKKKNPVRWPHPLVHDFFFKRPPAGPR